MNMKGDVRLHVLVIQRTDHLWSCTMTYDARKTKVHCSAGSCPTDQDSSVNDLTVASTEPSRAATWECFFNGTQWTGSFCQTVLSLGNSLSKDTDLLHRFHPSSLEWPVWVLTWILKMLVLLSLCTFGYCPRAGQSIWRYLVPSLCWYQKRLGSVGNFCKQSLNCTTCTLQLLQQQVHHTTGKEAASTLPTLTNICTQDLPQ